MIKQNYRFAFRPSNLLDFRILGDRDDDFSVGVAFCEVAHRLGQLAQLVLAVDKRRHFSGFQKFIHEDQIFSIHISDEEDDFLAGTQGSQADPDDVSQWPNETIGLRSSNDDEGRVGFQDASTLPQTLIPPKAMLLLSAWMLGLWLSFSGVLFSWIMVFLERLNSPRDAPANSHKSCGILDWENISPIR